MEARGTNDIPEEGHGQVVLDTRFTAGVLARLAEKTVDGLERPIRPDVRGKEPHDLWIGMVREDHGGVVGTKSRSTTR